MSAEGAGEDEVDGRTLYLYDGESADCDFEVGVLRVAGSEEGSGVFVEVILICALEAKSLVAVPQAAWHRRAVNRNLPPGSFSKPVAVEVAGAARDDRAAVLSDRRLKVWLGFLKDDLVEALDFEHDGEDLDVAFSTTGGDTGFVPHAEALMEVAKDKYQFATATEGEQQLPIAAPGPPPSDSGLEGRLSRLEASLGTLASTMQALTKERVQQQPAPPAQKAKAPQEAPVMPGLDAGVVKSALAAGVDLESLQQFSRLVGNNPARRLKDARAAPRNQSALEESDEEAAAEPHIAPPPVLEASPSDPVAEALLKLTTLVEDLQAQKLKKGTRLEQALDGASGGSGGLEGGGVSTRKNSMARRALRQALHENPEEIYGTIERLMTEDLLSRTVAPGMPTPTLCARAWLENRSRLTNYPAAIRTAWGVAGILNCLVNSNPAEARARAALMLLQADQVALDRGSWTLAAEASLELAPPFHSFANRAPPDPTEQPMSRLMEPRWGEIFLHHLRDTEDYVERRRKLGPKPPKVPGEGEGQPAAKDKPGPKPKPKAKTTAEPHA